MNILPVNSFANHERETEYDQTKLLSAGVEVSSPSETAQLPFHHSRSLREETLSALKILTLGRKIFLSGGQVPFNMQPGWALDGGRGSAARIPAVPLLLARLCEYHPKENLTHEPRLRLEPFQMCPVAKGCGADPQPIQPPLQNPPLQPWSTRAHLRTQLWCPAGAGTAGWPLPAPVSEPFTITHYRLYFTGFFDSFMTAVPLVPVVPHPYYC